MEIIDHELKKNENAEDKKQLSPSNQKGGSPVGKDSKKRQSMIPIGKRRSDSANRLSASKEEFRLEFFIYLQITFNENYMFQ